MYTFEQTLRLECLEYIAVVGYNLYAMPKMLVYLTFVIPKTLST